MRYPKVNIWIKDKRQADERLGIRLMKDFEKKQENVLEAGEQSKRIKFLGVVEE